MCHGFKLYIDQCCTEDTLERRSGALACSGKSSTASAAASRQYIWAVDCTVGPANFAAALMIVSTRGWASPTRLASDLRASAALVLASLFFKRGLMGALTPLTLRFAARRRLARA